MMSCFTKAHPDPGPYGFRDEFCERLRDMVAVDTRLAAEVLASLGYIRVGRENAERFLRVSRDIEERQDLMAEPQLTVRFEAKEKGPGSPEPCVCGGVEHVDGGCLCGATSSSSPRRP